MQYTTGTIKNYFKLSKNKKQFKIGCTNVCFNMFSPISHIRFWSFQIILVCTPSIVFMVYRYSSNSLTNRCSTDLFYSAHKVKGNEGGKSGKKEKQKEEPSPVSSL